MKEIKAFIHRNRIADVIHALKNAGFKNLSITDVRGMLKAMDNKEQTYSVELGEAVINEIRLVLFCEDEQAEEAVNLIVQQARTGQPDAGWVYVNDIGQAIRIEG